MDLDNAALLPSQYSIDLARSGCADTWHTGGVLMLLACGLVAALAGEAWTSTQTVHQTS